MWFPPDARGSEPWKEGASTSLANFFYCSSKEKSWPLANVAKVSCRKGLRPPAAPREGNKETGIRHFDGKGVMEGLLQ